MNLNKIRKHIRQSGNPVIADHSQRFFKTGPGEYGEGDKFLGIRVPIQRNLAKTYQDISLEMATKLLTSKFHEERLISLFILVLQFNRGTQQTKQKIYRLYLKNTTYINNWDLVDSSAEQIVGACLYERSRSPIFKLARSKSLWERRIAIMATFYFIKRNEFYDTLNIARILLDDDEDLIHKAVGWMLREVGKRNLKMEEYFLKKHYNEMPRTMLRYAIEKFPPQKRKAYLKGTL